jgi:hypothetical protein
MDRMLVRAVKPLRQHVPRYVQDLGRRRCRVGISLLGLAINSLINITFIAYYVYMSRPPKKDIQNWVENIFATRKRQVAGYFYTSS